MNSLITGKTPATAANVGAVASDFQGAYNNNPNNPNAATGFAISEAAYAGLLFDQELGGPSPGDARKSNAEAARAVRLSQFGQALQIWKVPGLLSSNGSISWPVATDLLPNDFGPVPVPNGGHLQAALIPLDQDLAECEQALLVPLSTPGFTFTIADPTNPNDTQGLKLGTAEFDLLYAIVASLRSVINPTLAYNFNYTDYTTATGLYSIAQSQMSTAGATIGPNIYMPASPFLTLNSDGATRMATTGTELAAVATHATNSINEIETRNNNGYLLNPGTFVTDQELDSIKSQIASYQTYLDGNAQINVINGDGNTVPATINLHNWFTNPPPDLKAFEPTYTVAVNIDSNSTTGFDTTLELTPSSFPDLTFDHLFPDGFPTPVSESSKVIGPADPTDPEYFSLVFVSSDSLGWLSPDLNWLTVFNDAQGNPIP